jgi:hypothetical protein
MSPNAEQAAGRPADAGDTDRREFLKKAVVASAAIAAAGAAGEAKGAKPSDAKPQAALLPQIRLGAHSISRLICGANPFGAGSHLSVFVNHQMRSYYTPEQILKTLARCEEVGINCWQSGTGNCDLYRRHRAAGGKMHYIAIASGDQESVDALKAAGCIAVAHHGEATDRMFKDGKLKRMCEYLKRVRDAGMQVGVSTHMPDVVDAVESAGWDVDYYMTCVYERHRSAAALTKLLGQAPIPVGEVYLPNDPPRMYKAIRQTKRPCLAFKILAAGRLSERPQWVEQAFRQTFQSIKPIDGAIVGIYDQYSDQPAECARFVRRFGGVKT